MEALTKTNYTFPKQSGFYRGKVRDVYQIGSNLLVMIATDRISAFDVVLPRGIPYKGQVLNTIAAKFMNETTHILPNWIIEVPHPNVTVGKKCEPLKVEMVIRGYLSGHAWREYRDGKRTICGVSMPEGMHENDAFPQPIITPSTKADSGHDEDISPREIIEQGLVEREVYEQLESYTRQLFSFGTQRAAGQGLILVDTKYEFGLDETGNVTLIDEIHTPDSSGYFYLEVYEERQQKGERQKQLSKEFVREWLIANDFQGLKGQQLPDMSDAVIGSVTDRYIELYEQLTGETFLKTGYENISKDMEEQLTRCLLAMH
ncbi:MAG: phosphoribosylaminoimidazolesuccinocarboxamide synthase [Flavobacteriales bacterium]